MNNATNIIITIALGFVAYKILGLVGKFTGAVSTGIDYITGTGDSEAEQNNAILQSNNEAIKFFVPSYGFAKVRAKYPDINSYYLKVKNFSSNQADQLAENIYQSKGLVNDNELTVYQAFIQMPSLACLSLVAHRFIMLHPAKGNLMTYLTTFLSTKELATVIDIINKKPIF